MTINREKRIELLGRIRFDAGQAERAHPERSAKGYLPVADHLRALEPEVVLIVGDRGAGKSMLVRIALARAEREAAMRLAPNVRAPTGSVDWRRTWPLDHVGPDPRGWRAFVASHRGDQEAASDLWWGYLLRAIQDQLDAPARERLSELFSAQGGDVERCFASFRSAGAETLLALDRLDQHLAENDQWLFVAYDELDTIVPSDPDALRAVIRGLISFWVAYSRRWHRLRAKIFIRTDFYRRFGNVAGADLAKLAASRVELTWSDRNLYAVLLKQFANTHEELLEYARKGDLTFDEDPHFGHIPRLPRKEGARPFVERLVGKYMGEGHKKGQSFTWLLDHLRDGNGRVAPRTLIRLIEAAAEVEKNHPRASGVQLIHPTALRQALDQVSEDHVGGSIAELGWLKGLKSRLDERREVPWERRELERLLRNRFDESWGGEGEEIRPPVNDSKELLDLLVELGIVRPRSTDKYDVPDLYLKGLNLLRRGGVRRK